MPETSSDSAIQQQRKKIDYSTDPMPTLPSDIIVEILLRLPVKSLLKFRSVSKSWLSLISSPEFIKAHLKNSTNDPNLTFHRILFTMSDDSDRLSNLNNCSVRSLLYEPMTDAVSIDYPGKDSGGFVNIVGSCNGLICILIQEMDLFLWNPSLRKSKKLPDLDYPRAGDSYIIYGFGFGEINEDYKVLGVFYVIDDDRKFERVSSVYSLKTNSWRRIEDCNVGMPIEYPFIFAQGKLHWCVDSGVMYRWNIGCLDLGNETYGMIEQPNYGEGEFYPTLGVLEGCICVI